MLDLTFFNTVPAENYSTPTIVSIDLYDLSNFAKLLVENLEVPINISIPVYNLNPKNLSVIILIK